MTTKNKDVIYIPIYLAHIWKQICDEASANGVGKGYLLMQIWCKQNDVEMPEYRHGNQYTYGDGDEN